MDLKRFLTTEEKIAGVAISDYKISLAFLKKTVQNKETKFVVEKLKEVLLPKGIIEKGILKDKKGLEGSFKKLLLDFFGSKRKIPRVIPAVVSFPSLNFYFQLFDFPDKIAYEKLEESLKLQIGFSLPLDVEECYIDWGLVDEEEKKILLGLIRREIIDSYLDVFKKIPLLPIAFETFSLSLSRVFSLIENEISCLVYLSSDYLEISIFKSGNFKTQKGEISHTLKTGTIRFIDSYCLEEEEDKNKKIEDLIFRVINFYESDEIDRGEVKKIYLIGNPDDTFSLYDYLKKEGRLMKEIILPSIPFGSEKDLFDLNDLSKMIVLGANLRGFVPREEDEFISFLPLDSKECYFKTQIISLLDFIKNSSIVVFIILTMLFGFTYYLLRQFSISAQNELNSLNTRPETSELSKIKDLAGSFNKAVALMETLEKERYNWSLFFEELMKNKTSGIVFTEINAVSPEKDIFLKGTAETRENLIAFKENLDSSGFFKTVDLPTKLLEKKENIQFTIRLTIK